MLTATLLTKAAIIRVRAAKPVATRPVTVRVNELIKEKDRGMTHEMWADIAPG